MMTSGILHSRNRPWRAVLGNAANQLSSASGRFRLSGQAAPTGLETGIKTELAGRRVQFERAIRMQGNAWLVETADLT